MHSHPLRPSHTDTGTPLIDFDTAGLMLLLMDLQAVLAYLSNEDAPPDTITFATIRSHARRTYDEAVLVLDSSTLPDHTRRYLESQLAILKARLALLGESF